MQIAVNSQRGITQVLLNKIIPGIITDFPGRGQLKITIEIQGLGSLIRSSRVIHKIEVIAYREVKGNFEIKIVLRIPVYIVQF